MPNVNKVHLYTATRQKGKSTTAAIDLTAALTRATIKSKLLYWFPLKAAQQLFEAAALHNLGYEPLSFAQRRDLSVTGHGTIRSLLSQLENGAIVFVDDLPIAHLAELVEGIERFSDVEAFVTVYTENTDAGVGE